MPKFLEKIIQKNLKKYKEGGYSSSRQAVAVSCSMTKEILGKLVSNLKTKKIIFIYFILGINPCFLIFQLNSIILVLMLLEYQVPIYTNHNT